MRLSLSAAYSSWKFATFDEKLNVYTSAPSFGDLHSTAKKATELGFEGVEIEALNEKQLYEVFTKKKIREMRSLFDELDLEVPMFIGYSIASMLEKGKKKEALEKVVEVAGEVGAPTIEMGFPIPSGVKVKSYAFPGGPPSKLSVNEEFSWNAVWKEYVDLIRLCVDMVEDAGLLLAVEPRPYDIVSNSDTLLRLFDTVPSKVLGANIDTGHLFVQKETLPISIEKLKDRIFMGHMSDNDGCRDDHLAPGKGKINWRDVLASLKKVGYNGFLSVEITNVEDLDKEYREGKEHLEKVALEISY